MVEADINSPYSLYFHVPFCTRKCDYCHFYVIPSQSRHQELYLKALQQEWDLRKTLFLANQPLSIYFGGGTPSLLPPEAIASILSWISPSTECEITLEVNPENVSLEKMRAFRQAGVNRISLGVQSLDDHLLSTLTRTHSAIHSIEAIETIAQSGLTNISIDLMYDLPGQTLQSWQTTVQKALALPLTHLSLYNLTIEPHTVFYKHRTKLTLPDDQLSLDMLSLAIDTLENKGFERYEISAFSLGGKISIHNTGYWTNRSFLGFGPSAFSFWNQSRFSNHANLHRYANALERGEDPVSFTESLSPHELIKESLAIGLRRLQGVPIQPWPSAIQSGLERLIQANLLEQTKDHMRLTSKGLLFHDTVASEIINL